MKCLACDCEDFEIKQYRFDPEVKGETVEVVVPAYVCVNCAQPLVDSKQMNVLRRAAADAYKKKHGLLTSNQIVDFRNRWDMSQAMFASYLKVGEASIKRWETYYVQDLSQDEHIRLKCDEVYAEQNALQVHWKSHPPDIYSGFRPFNWTLFKQTILYFLKVAKSPLFLNKALFYADFKHYQKYGKSITGARYIPLEYGPCPDQYQGMIQYLLDEGVLIRGSHHELKGKKPDLSLFDDAERDTLEAIYFLAKADGGKHLLDLSHQEKAFKDTSALHFISYDYAKKLMI